MEDNRGQHQSGEVLLLYLADELSAADRLEVEHCLAADAAFRQELESLRATHELCLAVVSESQQGSTAGSPASLRRATRMVAQWAQQRRVEKIVIPPPLRQNTPWARYGVMAAAAMILITGLGFWAVNFFVSSVPTRMDNPVVAQLQPLSKADQLEIVAVSMDEWPSNDFGSLALASPDNTDVFTESGSNLENK